MRCSLARRPIPLAVFVPLFVASGCAASSDGAVDEPTAADGITSTTVDAESSSEPLDLDWHALESCLHARYGHPPLNYSDAIDNVPILGQSAAPVEFSIVENAFITANAQSERLRGTGISITPYELIVNQLVEGAVLITRNDPTRTQLRNWYEIWQMSGVQEIYFRGTGRPLYSWFDRITDLEVARRVHGCEHTPAWREGSSDRTRCIQPISLGDGAHVHAAAWAEARERFVRNLRQLATLDLAQIDQSEWFYWTTIFYNTTETIAQRTLATQCSRANCTLAPRRFVGARDFANPRSNAARRVAIFQAMRVVIRTLPQLAVRIPGALATQADVCP